MVAVLSHFKQWLGIDPRDTLHALWTYPRFMGTIKPELMRSSEPETLARLQSLERCWKPTALRTPVGRRVLVLTPHPGDETIGAGGFLLAHREKAEVHLLNLFDGSRGGRLRDWPESEDPDYRSTLVGARRAEFQKVGRQLGAASIRYMNWPDDSFVPDLAAAQRLREAVDRVRPDVVLLPWYLDSHRDHRVANILFAWGCADLKCQVLSYEIWSMCQPNAMLDVGQQMEEKLRLVELYETQNATVDYAAYVRGLASTRAFLRGSNPRRDGAVEAFFSLPSRDYCDLVRSFYGEPDHLTPAALSLL